MKELLLGLGASILTVCALVWYSYGLPAAMIVGFACVHNLILVYGGYQIGKRVRSTEPTVKESN